MTPATVATPRRLAQLSEGIPRPFWALLVGTFITKAGSFVMPLLFVYLTRARGLPLPLGGAITSLYGMGSFFGAILGGVMADRLGRRVTMLASLVVGATFLLVLGLSTELWQLALATFLTGLTSDVYRPASQALITDLVPPAYRMKAFGLQYWAINLGFALASVIGGSMANRNFTALFIGDAATTLTLALIVWRAVPETRPEAAKGPQGGGGGGVLTPFLDGRYAPFLFLNFLIALLFFQHLSSLPDDMMHKGLTTEAYGWAVATNGLLIVLVQPFVIRWLDGVAPARLLALGAALTGVGFGLTTFASTLPMYALTVAVWTAGEIVLSPVNASLVAQLSPDHLRGRYQGAFTITWSLAAMASPLLGSALLPLVGHRALWFSCGAIGLGVAAVHLTLSARALPKAAVSE